MTTENFNPQAAAPAPESGDTTQPETENLASAEQEVEGSENPEPRLFTQEEFDKALQKRLGIEQRRMAREAAQRTDAPKFVGSDPPDHTKFKTQEEYIEAVVEWRAEQKIAQREQEQALTKAQQAFEDRMEQGRDKYDDYDAVVFDKSLRITQEMLATMMESDIGHEIAYHLGKNPNEARRIASLKSPLAQAREIGKIESALVANPPVKKASSAPEPINPVGARNPSTKVSASDPRSSKMSTSEWMEARNREIRAQQQR